MLAFTKSDNENNKECKWYEHNKKLASNENESQEKKSSQWLEFSISLTCT